MLKLNLLKTSCNCWGPPKIEGLGLSWFRRGLESPQGMSRFSHLVNPLKKTNCKRRTFRTRRLISGEPRNSRPMGWARGSQDLPAAGESTLAGLRPGALVAGEIQGHWPTR